MNHLCNFFVCVVLFLSVTTAQSSDTSKTYFSPKLRLDSWQNDLILDNEIPSFINFTNDSATVWMRTRMQLSGMVSKEDPIKNNFKTYILDPLNQQYKASQSFKELKYILGMVQTGGAAYIAYKHIKKYGFLKKN